MICGRISLTTLAVARVLMSSVHALPSVVRLLSAVTSTCVTSLPPAGGHVRLDVFDVQGRLVIRLADEAKIGGLHTATWDGRHADGRELPAGIYLRRLTLGEWEPPRKMPVPK